jgi:hypothetical protein
MKLSPVPQEVFQCCIFIRVRQVQTCFCYQYIDIDSQHPKIITAASHLKKNFFALFKVFDSTEGCLTFASMSMVFLN